MVQNHLKRLRSIRKYQLGRERKYTFFFCQGWEVMILVTILLLLKDSMTMAIYKNNNNNNNNKKLGACLNFY
jgi:hypothetical protein